MLHIQDLTYRIAGRVLLQGATAHLPKGHKGGLVGRNGIGKSTLFNLILGRLQPDAGSVHVQKGARIGIVSQEIPGSEKTPLEFVLDADVERKELLELVETETDPMKAAEYYVRLAEIDAYSAPAEAAKILLGLGFLEEDQHRPLSSFSGGWRMRVALAAALFSKPDLLLLDEPTNHLDLESVVWFEKFLKSYAYTVLIISHDRDLLNNVVDRIYHVHNQEISLYNGNYDFFERTYRERLAMQQAAQAKQEAAKKHLGKFIDRFRFKSSKARQVQSKIKMLERFEPITIIQDDPVYNLHFPSPDELKPPLMTLEKVQAGYGDKVILKNLNQRLDQDDRIALLGANGNGKSTFAKLLSGMIKPLKGAMNASDKVRVGYYHQHQVEALRLDESPFDHLRALMPGVLPAQVRARLGQFGFSQEKADMAVGKMSGGEKARLNFALVSALKPHILILDEPTNHLDMESRERLIMAINEYEGAVILITHDWHLLELTADRLWLVSDGTVKPYEEDLQEYRRFVLSGGKEEKKPKNPSVKGKGKPKKK